MPQQGQLGGGGADWRVTIGRKNGMVGKKQCDGIAFSGHDGHGYTPESNRQTNRSKQFTTI